LSVFFQELTSIAVRVNEFLQSVSNPAVYAAGDAAASGGPPLAPVASYEGLIVAANLLKGDHQRPNYLGIPSVVFTIPPLATVGLSEHGAREQNLKFRVKKEMTSTWYSSRRVAETYSGYKVLVEEGTDRILGAHILACFIHQEQKCALECGVSGRGTARRGLKGLMSVAAAFCKRMERFFGQSSALDYSERVSSISETG
jgi:glutathione reductase (NADPH)